MALSDIRTQIKSNIQTATNLDKTVYDYERYSKDMKAAKELFIEDDILHTWDVRRVDFIREHQAGHGGVIYITHMFELRGYYRFNDTLESEKTFSDTIVDTICRQFEGDIQLGGYAQIINNPIKGTLSQEMFCNVLCHKVIINLEVIERRTF